MSLKMKNKKLFIFDSIGFNMLFKTSSFCNNKLYKDNFIVPSFPSWRMKIWVSDRLGTSFHNPETDAYKIGSISLRLFFHKMRLESW